MSATPPTLSRPAAGTLAARLEPDELAARFRHVRRTTMQLCAPLSPEDHVVQPMADASPAKWHLAHTTWFFETFVLGVLPAQPPPFDPTFEFLFNSYYETVGPRVERPRRGMLSRPSLDRVHGYRAEIDDRVLRALARGALDDAMLGTIELGLHHEQQHQELILTDAKYMLGTQPLQPAYRQLPRARPSAPEPMTWHTEAGGIVELGTSDPAFAFDNERPRHR
ncbi:MAG TPA: DinB family protein, partial [Kofleriaceae bacterium]